MNEILPARLWVGVFVRPEDVPELKKIGITTVICLQTDEDFRQYRLSPRELARTYENAGIEWRRIPIPDFDRESLRRSLPEAVAEVETALSGPKDKVYLHCSAGVNRSATTAAGYLIRVMGYSSMEAFDFLLSRRDCNPTLEVLESYEFISRNRSN